MAGSLHRLGRPGLADDNIRAVAASLKAGQYQSAQLYFDAAVWYQQHVLNQTVPTHLRRLVKAYVRSITRGVPAAKLKEAFPLAQLADAIDLTTAREAYDPGRPMHWPWQPGSCSGRRR